MEFLLHYLFSTSPYRCHDCDQRFLRSRRIGTPHPIDKPSHNHPRHA
jgi:hypothetical protein